VKNVKSFRHLIAFNGSLCYNILTIFTLFIFIYIFFNVLCKRFEGEFMIQGIVLAGGYSSRFNRNKMCALFNGKALILNTIDVMHQVCEKIYVITGYYHEEILETLKNYNFVEIVYNPNYDQGMFSSVKAGAHQVNHDFFIIPGDYPLVSESVYRQLLNGKKNIRVPSYKGRLGHPLFIKKELISDLINSSHNSLKEFRNSLDFEYITVNDPNILIDIDKIEDLDKIKERIDI